ncbi:MAG: MBL fold metallo-hydrolase [Lachnospira sp.]|nr:MBL fold metallo-hydrolase [Lachnospira sp.]
MKKLIIVCICCIIAIIGLYACSGNSGGSTFSIQFIDVGQGDAALIECDGKYMLIDAGDKQGGEKVYQVLQEKGIQKLDILVMSHLHQDHIGGLVKALTYASSIGITLSNDDDGNSEVFRNVEKQLLINDSKITVPRVGDTYSLGSAKVEVVDNSSSQENDSLVLLVTYGKTRFLFTGDIEYEAQKRIAEKYNDDFKIDLIKMPHHGSWQNMDLNRFIGALNPDYAVISCGKGNIYDHPHKDTINLLKQAEVKVYRTDEDGDIIVKSNGKTLSFTTSK